MTPWSIGCRTLVQLAGKKTRLMFVKFNFGWAAQLSTRSRIFLFFDDSSLSHFHSSSSKILEAVSYTHLFREIYGLICGTWCSGLFCGESRFEIFYKCQVKSPLHQS